MNKLQASRLVNNYIANLRLNQQFIDDINKLTKKNIRLNKIIETNIANQILDYHFQEINKQYINIEKFLDKEQFKQKLLKKYLFVFAQNEISNNMLTDVGGEANNLSFSSQDIDYRAAPIVVCRAFSDDKVSYKDYVFIGSQYQHHEHVMQQHSDIMQKCIDNNGNEYFACLYLYDNNIVYISQRDKNEYSNSDLIQILKNKIPNLQGIFYVNYLEQDNNGRYKLDKKITTRLARRIF